MDIEARIDELALALGLQPPRVFRQTAPIPDRGTGRTWRMLLRALVDVMDGKRVLIVSPLGSVQSRDLGEQLRSWARTLGGDPHLVEWCAPNQEDLRLRGRRNVCVYRDHARPGRPFSPARRIVVHNPRVELDGQDISHLLSSADLTLAPPREEGSEQCPSPPPAPSESASWGPRETASSPTPPPIHPAWRSLLLPTSSPNSIDSSALDTRPSSPNRRVEPPDERIRSSRVLSSTFSFVRDTGVDVASYGDFGARRQERTGPDAYFLDLQVSMEWASEFGPPPPDVPGLEGFAIHLDNYSPYGGGSTRTLHARYRIIPLYYGVRIDQTTLEEAQNAIVEAWFPPARAERYERIVAELQRETVQLRALSEAQRQSMYRVVREAIESGRVSMGDSNEYLWNTAPPENQPPLTLQDLQDAIERLGLQRPRPATIQTPPGGRPWLTGFAPEAEEKARALLFRLLSPEQRAMYEAKKYFDAIGCRTGHRYRVHHDRQINIHDLTRRRKLCYVCPDVPICDQLAAQKLLIEADEDHLLAVAAVW